METLLMVILITLGFSILIGVLIIQYQLYSYLNKNHHAKWEELTTIGKTFGPGCRNSFRGIKFLLSPETFDDPMVEKLKKRVIYTILGLIILFAILPYFAVAMVILFNIFPYM